jgi:hypothetical protein
MDLTEGSETSAKLNLTPGKYPKENIQMHIGLMDVILLHSGHQRVSAINVDIFRMVKTEIQIKIKKIYRK